MSWATRFKQNLISQNLRELLTTSSSTMKHVRQSRLTSSASDVESSVKRLRSDFITYKNTSFKDKSSLKCFDKTLKLSKTVSEVEMTSHWSEDQQSVQKFSKIDWIRKQITQIQIMIKQMFRSQCSVDLKELKQKEQELKRQQQHKQEKQQHEQEMT